MWRRKGTENVGWIRSLGKLIASLCLTHGSASSRLSIKLTWTHTCQECRISEAFFIHSGKVGPCLGNLARSPPTHSWLWNILLLNLRSQLYRAARKQEGRLSHTPDKHPSPHPHCVLGDGWPCTSESSTPNPSSWLSILGLLWGLKTI